MKLHDKIFTWSIANWSIIKLRDIMEMKSIKQTFAEALLFCVEGTAVYA